MIRELEKWKTRWSSEKVSMITVKICSRVAYKNGKESGINEWFDEQGFKVEF